MAELIFNNLDGEFKILIDEGTPVGQGKTIADAVEHCNSTWNISPSEIDTNGFEWRIQSEIKSLKNKVTRFHETTFIREGIMHQIRLLEGMV